MNTALAAGLIKFESPRALLRDQDPQQLGEIYDSQNLSKEILEVPDGRERHVAD
jgi:hypothetical protein